MSIDNIEDLDEYYEYENIISRLLARVPNTIDKREGSIIYDAIAPAAAELAQMYIVLKYNNDLAYVDTAVDEYLDKLVGMSGLTRQEATYAIKKGRFYDTEDNLMDISIGERFTVNNTDLVFTATEKIETGVYKMQCATAGTIGNSATGTMIPVTNINGLGRAELLEVLIPGEDVESDEELRQRFYDSVDEQTFSGNIADYKVKTKLIDGVGAVKVTPIWNGGGTVKLTILNSEFNKASNTLIENVQNEICPDLSNEGIGLAPIGHSVTVDTVTEQQITITTEIVKESTATTEEILEKITSSINAYLLTLKKTWEDSDSLVIRKAQIETIILNTDGVIDVLNVSINEQTGNVVLEVNEIPKLEEVVIE